MYHKKTLTWPQSEYKQGIFEALPQLVSFVLSVALTLAQLDPFTQHNSQTLLDKFKRRQDTAYLYIASIYVLQELT